MLGNHNNMVYVKLLGYCCVCKRIEFVTRSVNNPVLGKRLSTSLRQLSGLLAVYRKKKSITCLDKQDRDEKLRLTRGVTAAL